MATSWMQFLMGAAVVLGLMPGRTALAATDRFTLSAPGTVRIEGWLGRRLAANLEHLVLAQDADRLAQPFRDRKEAGGADRRGEAWGWWHTSAVLGYAYESTPSQGAILDRGLGALLATQAPDGSISTFPSGRPLDAWDVRERKGTLLGLLADHELRGNPAVLEATRRMADHLFREVAAGRARLSDDTNDVLAGLTFSSMLAPMARWHQRTGDGRSLALAEEIVTGWSRPGRSFTEGLRLVEQGLAGASPQTLGAGRADEVMSCFEGLCEMHRITGTRRYLDAAIGHAESIRRAERMIHGTGSNQERWCDGGRFQTELMEQPGEMCVTVAWMRLCLQLLRLTGAPQWADELELTLQNALLGALTPDGAWWARFSPLAGQRVPSPFQPADSPLSCCVASGSVGLLLTPRWAVMGCQGGVVVNLYVPGRVVHALEDGTRVTLVQETRYPVEEEVTLTVTPDAKARFPLHLRIPSWSQRSALTVNGQAVIVQPGTYAVLDREWAPGDRIVLQLDLRARAVPAPSGAPQLAVVRGPIVLALDDRLAGVRDLTVRLATDANGYVAVTPVVSPPASVRMAFEVPFEVRPRHDAAPYQTNLVLCDYASAGSGWGSENLFRVWLPQPLFLGHAFPRDTWRSMHPDLKECPPIPRRAPVAALADAGPVDVPEQRAERAATPADDVRDPERTVTASATVADAAASDLAPVAFELLGDWTVAVRVGASRDHPREVAGTFTVTPPGWVVVEDELHEALEEWKADQPGWGRRKLLALEQGLYTARHAVAPGSVRVAPAEAPERAFELDWDYRVDPEWGAIGRVRGGGIAADQAVLVSYRYGLRRIDSIVRTVSGALEWRPGEPHLATPVPPALAAGEERVANLWLPAGVRRLTDEHLYPILERAHPEPPARSPTEAERLLPRTMARLRSGEPLRILAWGDSVTEGYLGKDQWQEQFVRRLRERFPRANLTLVTVGWGAHSSVDFLNAPAGHPHNYVTAVLGARPDLVVSEFVNDGALDAPTIGQAYARFLSDFRHLGAEWIILTPHYHTFMGVSRERDLDEDPRAYVPLVRQFARANGVALADAAARYARLWRQGIPYTTLMVNTANHPDARGMALFADSLMALFPDQGSSTR